MGHWANECSKSESHPSKNLLLEEPVVDATNYVYGDSDSSEKIIYEDGGANLVIKKSLLAPKGDSNED